MDLDIAPAGFRAGRSRSDWHERPPNRQDKALVPRGRENQGSAWRTRTARHWRSNARGLQSTALAGVTMTRRPPCPHDGLQVAPSTTAGEIAHPSPTPGRWSSPGEPIRTTLEKGSLVKASHDRETDVKMQLDSQRRGRRGRCSVALGVLARRAHAATARTHAYVISPRWARVTRMPPADLGRRWMQQARVNVATWRKQSRVDW